MAHETARITVANYVFDATSNPYEHTNTNPANLSSIAKQISAALGSPDPQKPLIVRGIQSGKQKVDLGKSGTIFAAPYQGQATILQILEGFHKYNPKCQERPQCPVDTWLLFDATAYQNVEYLHPRHQVMARDKWKPVDPKEPGLVKVVTVN